MTYFIFLSTRPSSSPGLAGSRIDPSGLTEFQNYTFGNLFPLLGWLIFLPSNLGRSQFNPYIFIFLWDPDVINFINFTSNILGNSKLSFFINFDHTFFGMVSSFFFLIYVGCPGQLTRTTTIPHGPLDILQAQEQVRHRGGDRRAHRGSNPGRGQNKSHGWPQQLDPQVR